MTVWLTELKKYIKERRGKLKEDASLSGSEQGVLVAKGCMYELKMLEVFLEKKSRSSHVMR